MNKKSARMLYSIDILRLQFIKRAKKKPYFVLQISPARLTLLVLIYVLEVTCLKNLDPRKVSPHELQLLRKSRSQFSYEYEAQAG